MTNIKRKNVISWFQLLTIFYVSICLIGCTPHAIDFARERANLGYKYWTIEDVTFAAISTQRNLRLCAKLKRASEEVQTEISILLDSIPAQSNSKNKPIANIESGKKLQKVPVNPNSSFIFDESEDNDTTEIYAECNNELEEPEQAIKIIHKNIENNEFQTFLDEVGNGLQDEPALFVLASNGATYIYFNIPRNGTPAGQEQVIRCFGEDISEPGTYIIVPFAVVADVMMLVMFVILLPIIMLKAAGSGGRTGQGNFSFDIFPPTPRIFQPSCD